MDTFAHIVCLITPGCYMAVFDLKDAYLVVPIAGYHVKFLKFHWRGKWYMYIVLPFGLSSSPRKFTKLLKPVLTFLRRQGITIITYIDDGWVRGDTFQDCYTAINTTMKKFTELGFILSAEKSTARPSQSVQILGFLVDSVSMLITLPADKTEKLSHSLRKLFHTEQCEYVC